MLSGGQKTGEKERAKKKRKKRKKEKREKRKRRLTMRPPLLSAHSTYASAAGLMSAI